MAPKRRRWRLFGLGEYVVHGLPGVVLPRDGLLATFMGEDNRNGIDRLVRYVRLDSRVYVDRGAAGAGRCDLVPPLVFDTAPHRGEPRVACQSNSEVL